MWVQLAIMVISALIQYAMSTKPKPPTALTLGEVSIPTVEQGTPIGVNWGDVWCDNPMICWYGDLDTREIKSSGGKK
jgi:hypothetical protein